ncbi:MAG: recombinase family protein [Clostridia bacterium]|nr:recombinase family protein [Clostridia bacterium]
MLEAMAQYYSEELSQKVRRGMNETRLKGNYTGGFLIYGYKVENHKILIDEEKAEVVRFIYDQYAQGVYLKDIIAHLTAQGIFNRGKKFARNTVYNILKNEKYSGIYRHNDEVFDNIYPQIVPTEIYEIVRKKIETNKYGKRSVEVVYLLRNKLKCGYCGSPISAECGTAKNGEKIRYYKCLGRKHQNGCKKSQVRKEILEKYVLDNVIEQLSKPEIQNYIADRLIAIQERKIKENSALNALTKEMRQTENSINNIMEAIEQGGTSAMAMKRLRELESKLEDLQKQITIEKAKSAFRLSKADIIRFYKAGLEKEPIKLINHLIKKILLYDDKMIIFYNTPKTIDLDESQGFSFYDHNIKMPYVIQNKKNYGAQDFRLIIKIE